MENLEIWVPIWGGIVGFIIKYFFDQSEKSKNKLNDLKTNLIYISDKMVKSGVSVEYATLFFRFHDVIRHEFVLDSDIATRNAYDNASYYQKKSDSERQRFESLKSDLKKSVLDLKEYWDNHTDKCDLLELMNKIGQQTPRHFERKYIKQFKLLEQLKEQYEKDRLSVELEFYFSGVGLDLIRIQKIIDPTAQTFYLNKAQEKELAEIIHKRKCDESFCK